MKKEKYHNYIAFGLTGFLMIAACILFFFLLFRLQNAWGIVRNIIQVLEPFFVGVVIAYLTAPLYNLIVRNMKHFCARRLKPRFAKSLSVGCAVFVCIIASLFVIFGLLALVIPRFFNSIVGIFNSLDTYFNNFNLWLENLLGGHPELEEDVENTFQSIFTTFLNWLNTHLTPSTEALFSSLGDFDLGSILSGLVSGVRIMVRIFMDFIIGFIFSAYLLASKSRLIGQAKKIAYGIFHLRTANYILKECRYIHTVFGGFIRGRLLDSLIMGILCFVCCSIFRLPYPVVIGVVIGVTNIIPFFGPFIGAIPCAILILLVSPIQCLYFLIIIIILQQFDGNILGPKILGNTTGLSSFWVLFSIILFGGLFGFVGMIIAVPLFAVIYSLISAFINRRLRKKDLSQKTEDYEMLDHVDENDQNYIHMKDPTVK